MKTVAISFVFLFLATALNAQVTLEKKYDYSTSVVELETLGYKYFLMDVPKSQCRIYNLDHSLFKTINCPVPNNFYLADVKYISEKLFDSDDGLELVYTYYKYVSTSNSYYYEYDSKVINEDGSALTTIDGARYIYVNKTGNDTYKMFAYCFDYSVFPEKVWTNIYNLPGTSVLSMLNKVPEFNLDIFPNPASEKVNIFYTLPENEDEGILHIIDNSGRLINQFTVDNHTNYLSLDVQPYQDGIYHYFIECNGSRTPTKKIVIQ